MFSPRRFYNKQIVISCSWNPRDFRAVFLDISKAFDKVWYDGLIFKLKQNRIAGNRLKLFESYLQKKACGP